MSNFFTSINAFSLTDWLAILGAILGLAGFVISLISLTRHRRKVKAVFIARLSIENEKNCIFYELIISNLSMSPLAVNYLILKNITGEGLYNHLDKIAVPDWCDDETGYTTKIPFTIPPFESVRGIFAFQKNAELGFASSIIGRKLFLQLNTTRGNITTRIKSPYK